MTRGSRNAAAREDELDVAIIGMACFFPGAGNLVEYWQNIVNAVDCVTDPPPEWQPELFLDPSGEREDRAYVGRGGFLGDVCRFDPIKYGVMPNSVDGAEPDHFLALRCAVEALEDAGVPELPLNRERTGVILGRGTFVNRGYLTLLQRGMMVDQVVELLRGLDPKRSADDLERIRAELRSQLPPSSAETAPGLAHSVLVGRIANRLDLRGPAYTLDAACASSLLALEHGVQKLRSGLCDAVLVGGVQVSTPGFIHLVFCQLDALSRRGEIAPFSAEASGTLLGAGCGVLVLKRLGDAERDGNRVYAVVKEVGVSSDGRGAGLLAPRKEGQVLCMERAYSQSGIDVASIGLIEAHGSGIPLGDATEFASLREVFGRRRPRAEVAVGSVKSMISHLIPAAGAASLIKTALALHQRVLPPTLHAEVPNPALLLEESPFYLSSRTRPWIHSRKSGPRRAGVNAFGFGGINAHAILEEHAGSDAAGAPDFERRWPSELVVVSAKDRPALVRRAEQLADWIERAGGIELLDVAATCARELHPARLSICARNLEELIERLRSAAKALRDPKRDRIQDRRGVFYYDTPLARSGRVAFVFPGEGAQYVDMLAELCRHFPALRRAFDLTDTALDSSTAPLAPSRMIFPLPEEVAAAERGIFEFQTAIESVATANRGLLALLRELGVSCDAVVGHSSGEFTALASAGAIEIEGEAELERCIAGGAALTERVRRSDRLSSAALIAVGGTDPDALREVVAETGPELEVAIDNCPHQVVLVGTEAVAERALTLLQSRGGLCQRLAWDRPYHTQRYLPICEFIEDFYATLAFRVPKVEVWSCSIADRYPADPHAIRELAVRQWSTPVRFRETVEAMYESGVRLFIEVGPRGNLSAFVSDTLRDRQHVAVPLDRPRRAGIDQLCRALGQLIAHSVPVRLEGLFERRNPRLLDIEAPPPVAPVPDPVLRLDLPTLALSEESMKELATRRFTGRSSAAPAGSEVTRPSAAPRKPDGSAQQDAPTSAFADFQHTMRVFLDTQRRVMTRLAGVVEPAVAGPELTRTTRSGTVCVRTDPTPSHSAPNGPEVPPDRISPGLPISGRGEGTDLELCLARIVSERTGYPPEMLDANANLEADLGIDSIKRVEIVAALRRQVLPELAEPPEWFMEHVVSARTIREIVALVCELVASDGVQPAEATETPERPPLLDGLLEHEIGVRLVAETELDVRRHQFLADHTLGRSVSANDPELSGLPVLPLAASMELMAEAAAALRPSERVVALCDVRALRWLAFERPTRRVHVEAHVLEDGAVHATVYAADREGMRVGVAEARVELGQGEPDLGPPRVRGEITGASRWEPEELYTNGLFHGPSLRVVQSMQGWGPRGARAALQSTAADPLRRGGFGQHFLLPIDLIDGTGQVTGFWGAEERLTMGFPVALKRLELRSPDASGQPLEARMDVETPEAGLWRSDHELIDADGRVVLRISGRLDRVLPIPEEFWRLRTDTRRVVLSRRLTESVAGIPGAEHCAVCELADFELPMEADTKAFWATGLSRLVLDAEERSRFDTMQRPLSARWSWLLGRAVAKDAVRLFGHLDCGMADLRITSDEHGAPRVGASLEQAPLLSLSHTGAYAVAVAGDPRALRAVGIDAEPIRALDPTLLEEAFYPEERQLLEAAGEPASREAWLIAGWTAKEAIGKALGRGVIGGPRSVRIVAVDTASGRLTAELEGPMAAAANGSIAPTRGPVSLVAAHRIVHRGYVVSLCLMPRE